MVEISSSVEMIKLLLADGWYLKRAKGSHHHFKHPTKAGTVTVPHPTKDLPFETEKSIRRQAALKAK